MTIEEARWIVYRYYYDGAGTSKLFVYRVVNAAAKCRGIWEGWIREGNIDDLLLEQIEEELKL